MPGLLAVPGILLHGCSGLGSIRRAYRLTELSFLPTALTLAFGVVLVPGAATWALESGLRLLPDPLTTLGWGLAGTVLALAITPFQAAVVARQFLHRMAWRTEVDDSDLAHGLPDGAPPRPVRPSLLPAALLPGLLFSGFVLVNPFGWPEIAGARASRCPRAGAASERDWPCHQRRGRPDDRLDRPQARAARPQLEPARHHPAQSHPGPEKTSPRTSAGGSPPWPGRTFAAPWTT